MNKQIMTVALLTLAGTTAALAAPRETFDVVALNGGNLIGTTALNGAGNSIVNLTATGGYSVLSVRAVGNVAFWGAGTYGSEATIRLTAPDGTTFVTFNPSTLASTPPGPVSFDISKNMTVATSTGTWAVQTYETFDDAGDDSTYDALSITLDDAALPPPPPPAATDLGNHAGAANNFTQTVTTLGGTDIQWFRIQLPAVQTVAGWVDIWTTPTGDANTDMTDTEIGLYNVNGDGASTIWNDDDGGPGLMSQLSYGSTTSRGVTTYGALTTGNDRNGNGGPLSGGVYYLAVGRFNVTWAAGFGAVGTSASLQTTTVLNFDIAPATAPYPPTGIGAANPTSAVIGSNVLLTVVVTPGGNPASTGIVVRGDVSGLGGSATQQFYDDGTHGDASAGDGTYSYSVTVPATASEGSASVAYTVTDAQTRTSGGTITFSLDVAGDQIATAYIPQGTGALDSISGNFSDNDVDMYKIQICDFANFSASTVGGATADTQLFLFNPDGTGVSSDDDTATNPQSTITSQFVTANGDYYIAVTRYNTDPVDSGGNLIWANTPFNTERAPDGPGSAGALSAWTGATFGAGTYTIAFTGTCYPSNGPICGPADIGSVGGVAGADGHLDNNDFIVYINNFFNADPSADIGVTGGVPGQDGAFDNNDFIVFIDQFFNAPATCR